MYIHVSRINSRVGSRKDSVIDHAFIRRGDGVWQSGVSIYEKLTVHAGIYSRKKLCIRWWNFLSKVIRSRLIFDVIPFPLPSLDVDYIFITKLSETLLYVYIYNRSSSVGYPGLNYECSIHRAVIREWKLSSRNAVVEFTFSFLTSPTVSNRNNHVQRRKLDWDRVQMLQRTTKKTTPKKKKK